MKVLVRPDKQRPTGDDILGFGLSEFEGLDGENAGLVGKVFETSDSFVRTAVRRATERPGNYLDTRTYMRDIRFIHKSLVEIEAGVEIGLKVNGSGYRLEIPEAARPERPVPVEGDVVAITDTISPTALMNVRGRLIALNGERATVKITEGDRRRVARKTGKRFTNEVKVPLSCLERDDEVEVA